MIRRHVGYVLTTVVGAALLLASGCGTEDGNRNVPPNEKDETAYGAEDAAERVLAANNRFAFELFENVRLENAGHNTFISPFSVAAALSMTYNGAAEETKDAMAEVLHIRDVSVEDVNRSHAALHNVVERTDPGVELNVANALWGREGTPFQPDFIRQVEKFYNSQVTELDFDHPQAPHVINEWVREETNGKIEDIVDSIDPETFLFLMNAIYFKGKWTNPFDPAGTVDADFYLRDGETKRVPMMSQSGEYAYCAGKGFQAVELPYGSGKFSMTIYLPEDRSSSEAFYAQLNVENWAKWSTEFEKMSGTVQLPRFQLTYDTTLNDALKAMGMGIAFDEQRANFDRMVDLSADPDVNAFIKQVKHKTFIEVNEEGAEASGATSVEVGIVSAPVDSFNMRVDRPFFFTIQDRETGTLLFMGAVEEPE